MTDSAPLVVIPHARFIEYQARHRTKAAQSAEQDRLRTIMAAELDAPVSNDGTPERFAEAVQSALPQPTTGASRT